MHRTAWCIRATDALITPVVPQLFFTLRLRIRDPDDAAAGSGSSPDSALRQTRSCAILYEFIAAI
ncbi:MAG: hypothetical protein ABI379_11895, partial [Rhodanobacter sp.]